MNKTILTLSFIFALSFPCYAQTNTSETLTITTYYPSPYGVYKNLRLHPTSQPTTGVAPGVMFYNNTSDSIMYYNKTGQWVNLGGGAGGIAGGWEHNTTSGNVYNVNTGSVGIGTQNPFAQLNVHSSVSQGRIGISGVSDTGFTYSGLYLHDNTADSDNAWVLAHKNDLGTLNENDFQIRKVTTAGSSRIDLSIDNSTGYVGIGTGNPVAPLNVETNGLGSPLILKNAIGTASQSGSAAITPHGDWLWITSGCYIDADDHFVQDAYHSTGRNFKFALNPRYGAYWYASSNAPAQYWDLTTFGGNTRVQLWNMTGAWVGNVTLPTVAVTCTPGALKYESDHFYGCKSGGVWLQLDNN